MNRREFMKLSAMAIAAPSFGKAATPDNTPTSNQPSKPPQQSSIFRVKPHIQLFSENTVEIVWITNVNATGYVTWSQDNWKTFTRAWNEEDGLLSANTNIHRALITDFNPKKPLEFKAHSRPFKLFGPYRINYSAEEEVYFGKMRAICPDDNTVSWAMFNDVHENLSVYDTFMPHLSDVNSLCIFNGDILNHVDNQSDVIDRLVEPFSRIAKGAELPVWYVRGNHETRGGFARDMRNYLALKNGSYYGAATIGDVRFVFLDCGEDKPDAHKAYSGLVDFDSYIARQNAWLEKEVKSNEWVNAKARVAVRHIPMLMSKWDHKLPRLSHMDNILKNANVSLGLSAHIHCWIYDRPNKNRPYPLFTGGGQRLGNPQSRSDATLVKCCYSNGKIDVKILDQTGKAVITETVKI